MKAQERADAAYQRRMRRLSNFFFAVAAAGAAFLIFTF